MSEPRLHFDGSVMFENGATFAITDNNGGHKGKWLAIAVSEEQAVDSYNQNFETKIHLNVAQVATLRDWLAEHYPR